MPPTKKDAPTRGPGRPRTGRTKATVSISFDLDILVWLNGLMEKDGDGRLSAVVNAQLRSVMEPRPKAK